MVMVVMVVAVVACTSISMRPSSIRIWPPLRTSAGRPAKLMEAMVLSPSTGSVVRVKESPARSSTFGSLKAPRRISGPLVSMRMAMGRRSSSRRALTMSMRAL